MNNRLKLDTTVLQSNTVMHLIAFIITQRELLLQFVNGDDIVIKDLMEVQEDCEYILKKHTNALHKRCGTKIYDDIDGKDEDGPWSDNLHPLGSLND